VGLGLRCQAGSSIAKLGWASLGEERHHDRCWRVPWPRATRSAPVAPGLPWQSGAGAANPCL